MFGVTDLPTYLVGLALIVLLPGPNSLYVLSTAARRGVRAGYTAVGGVMCGDTVLMALSAGGVASLLQASPAAFAVVKWAGAGYLSWLAFGMLRGAWRLWRSHGARLSKAAGGGVGPKAENPFRRAFVVSLLNPKAILFFVSFFVQFVDPSYGQPALAFLFLGVWAQLFSLAYLTLLIFGGTRLAAVFRSRHRLKAGVTAGAGAAFLGFAVKLSLVEAA
ncbi:Leucine efflux protein [Streptomyces sp. RB5]|uniref:Leucine efflux protein n=1 Tax=Streptomyces smaragdinus TaxID=2585196 RepID=A0A7K0CQS1_9ACTN|nr:leucine efflux protein LeuE [Streptomyces smaragdinus]MQY15673.1 Leucine efflux protein [Streptomyces smaragdinus]